MRMIMKIVVLNFHPARMLLPRYCMRSRLESWIFTSFLIYWIIVWITSSSSILLLTAVNDKLFTVCVPLRVSSILFDFNGEELGILFAGFSLRSVFSSVDTIFSFPDSIAWWFEESSLSEWQKKILIVLSIKCQRMLKRWKKFECQGHGEITVIFEFTVSNSLAIFWKNWNEPSFVRNRKTEEIRKTLKSKYSF